MNKIRLILLVLILLITIPLSAQKIIPAQNNGKWGCIDLWDNEAIPFVYDTVYQTRNDAALVVKERGKWKIINKDGKYDNNKYDFISRLDWDDFAFAKQNNKWGVVDKYGRSILAQQFDSIVTWYSDYGDGAKYYSDLFIGYKQNKGIAYYKNKKIPMAKYDSVRIVGYEDYLLVCKNYKCGIVDTLGQVVVPIEYKDIGSFLYNDRYIYVKQEKESYYYDLMTNKTIASEEFDKHLHQDGLRKVSLSDCDIYVNREGEDAFGKRFHTARDFEEGVALVTNFDLSRQVIDSLGNILFDVPKDSYIGDFRGGLAKYYNWKAGNGLIDKKGKFVIEPRYEKIDYSRYRNYIKATTDSLIHYYDRSGHLLNYTSIQYLSDIEYAVERNGKWGVADSLFSEVVPLVYDSISSQGEGLIAASRNGKWGYIDKSNKEVIPFIYDEVNEFFEDLSIVKYNGKYGIIDKRNRLRVSFRYDEIPDYSGLKEIEILDLEVEQWYTDRFYETPSIIF